MRRARIETGALLAGLALLLAPASAGAAPAAAKVGPRAAPAAPGAASGSGEVVETEAFGRVVRIPGPPGMINVLRRVPPGSARSHSEVRAIFLPDSVWRASGEGRRPPRGDLFIVASVEKESSADERTNAQGLLAAQAAWAERARRSSDPRRLRVLEALRRVEKGGDGRIQPPVVLGTGDGFPLEVETRNTRAVTLLSVQRQEPGEGPGECVATALVLVRGRVLHLMYARLAPLTTRTEIEVRGAMRRWVAAVLAAN